MAYKRKTTDEYRIMVKYSDHEGWEHECTEMTRDEAIATRKEYRENAPEYPVIIIKKRVKIDQ